MNITMTTTRFNRTESGKSWMSKPIEVTNETIGKHSLECMTSADTCKFFRRLGGYEKLDYTYTQFGYLPYRLISISPDRELRIVREFEYNE